MKRRGLATLLALFFLSFSICGCGSSPWRYDPGTPERPSGLVATAGDGEVTLSWSPANGAAGYNVYCATSSGGSAASVAKIANVTGSSAVVSGLGNGTRYYFVVSAVNAKGESAVSDEASGIPSPPGPFRQADLQGTWRFNALVSGEDARWMRGVAVIDAGGGVTVASFADSTGGNVAPAELFSTMSIQPDGSVSQAGAAAGFHGVLAANLYKDMVVGTSSLGGASRMMVVLQKVVSGITFSAADIKGTGRLVAGPLAYVYHQLSSGGLREWEYASCQVGQDQGVTYLSINAPTPRQLPGGGSKVVSLSITADGIVAETLYPGVVPQPAALITEGVMSADKMTVVGTATDASGAPVLRIMQLVHPPAVLLTSASYTAADLAGEYGFHALYGAAGPGWAYGEQSVDAIGTAAFSSWRDAGGTISLPASYTLTLDQQGALTDAADPSFHGEFSYFKDMMVSIRTDAAGAHSLGIALRRSP